MQVLDNDTVDKLYRDSFTPGIKSMTDAIREGRTSQRHQGEEFMSESQAARDEAEEYYFGTVRPPHTFDVVIERPVDRTMG